MPGGRIARYFQQMVIQKAANAENPAIIEREGGSYPEWPNRSGGCYRVAAAARVGTGSSPSGAGLGGCHASR